ncbi:VOC family protein [Cobetia crustatorum]|uniref:VOC family protein n=1 Tax=Cobetia crustatorum TaxID=553385 RepID=UPI0031F70EE4
MTARMPLSHVHHVALITADYSRAKRFYLEVMDAEILGEVYRKARDSYKLDLCLPGGIQLELFSFPSPPPRPSYPRSVWSSPSGIGNGRHRYLCGTADSPWCFS